MVFYAQSQTVEDDANTNKMLELFVVHEDICQLFQKGKIFCQRCLSCSEHSHYRRLWGWAAYFKVATDLRNIIMSTWKTFISIYSVSPNKED